MPVWRGLLARWPHARLRASEDAVGPAARADGQLGGRPPEPRRRPAGAPGPAADRRRDRRRLVLRRDRRCSTPATAPREPGRPAARRQPRRARRRPRQRPPPRRPRRARAPDGACRRSGSTRCSTAATRRPGRRCAFVADLEAPARARPTRTPGSRRSAGATSRWIATSAGTGRRAATTRSSTASASAPRPRSTAIAAAYARGENDEFVAPTVIDGVDGRVRDGDAIVHANFRADRARQLTHALADGDDFAGVRPRRAAGPRPRDLLVVTMTAYEAGLPVEVAFPPEEAYSLAHARPTPAGASSTSPRPRSTPTSRTSSTAGARRRCPGEDRLLDPEPEGRDLRPPAGDERGGRHRRAGRRPSRATPTT